MIFSSQPMQWSVTVLLVLAWSASVAGTTVIDTGSAAQSPPGADIMRTLGATASAQGCQALSLPGSPAASKIASSLRRVVQRMQQDGVTAANVTARHAERYATPLVHVDTEGRVHTAILVTALDAQVESVLTMHQVAIEHADAQAHLVQAWIPFDCLEVVAALPSVRYLRPPSYASRR